MGAAAQFVGPISKLITGVNVTKPGELFGMDANKLDQPGGAGGGADLFSLLSSLGNKGSQSGGGSAGGGAGGSIGGSTGSDIFGLK